MSGLLVTLAIDGAAPGRAIGIKEAIAMDLEKYGDVRVLRVEVREPEQLGMGLEQDTMEGGERRQRSRTKFKS